MSVGWERVLALSALLAACGGEQGKPVETAAPGESGLPPETGESGAAAAPARWSGELALDAVSAVTWLGEAAGDRLGRTVLGAGDTDGDGHADLLLGAYYRSEGYERNGEAYLLSGPATGWDGTLGAPELSVLGEQATAFVSRGMAGVGDMSGDGLADLLIGAPNHDAGTGRACLFEGGTTGTRALSEGLACVVGEGGLFGAFVSSPGDLDGDGVPDALVSALFDPRGGENAGAVSALLGPISAGETSSGDLLAWLGAAEDNAGWGTAGAGDLDGDGYPEIVIGMPGADDHDVDAGAAAVLRGPPPSAGTLRASAAALILGANAGDHAGMSVAGGQDLDGSGAPDLLVGAPGAGGGTGFGGVILDPALEGSRTLASADAGWPGSATGGQAGFQVATPGDLDGDGRGELLIGAYGGETGENVGSVALIYGAATFGAEPDAVFSGGEAGDFAGWFSASAGDTDGDGLPDLVIGAQRSDRAGEEAGRVHLVPGGPGDE